MNSTARRIICTAAATGVLSLAAAAPAMAKPEWTEPAGLAEGTGGTPTIVFRDVPVDDDAWEYAQVGLGVLAGATMVGAAAVALRRREDHALHPA